MTTASEPTAPRPLTVAVANKVAREYDRLVNSVRSSRVPPANEAGPPDPNGEAGSDQRRGLVRRSAPAS